MKLRNAILAGLMFGMAHGTVMAHSVGAKPTKGWFTYDAMGCMLFKNVRRISKEYLKLAKSRKFFPIMIGIL